MQYKWNELDAYQGVQHRNCFLWAEPIKPLHEGDVGVLLGNVVTFHRTPVINWRFGKGSIGNNGPDFTQYYARLEGKTCPFDMKPTKWKLPERLNFWHGKAINNLMVIPKGNQFMII